MNDDMSVLQTEAHMHADSESCQRHSNTDFVAINYFLVERKQRVACCKSVHFSDDFESFDGGVVRVPCVGK